MKAERKTVVLIAGAIFLLYLAIHYWDGFLGLVLGMLGAAMPLFIGFVIAYLVNILMTRYEKLYFPKGTSRAARKSRRPLCMILAMLSLVVIVAGVTLLIVPELVSCTQLLAKEIPVVWDQGITWLRENIHQERWDQLMSFVGGGSIDWAGITKKAGDWFLGGIGGAVNTIATVVTRTFSALVTALVSIIFSIYLLSGKEKLMAQTGRVARHYLKPRWFQRLRYVIEVLDNSFHRFIVGQCTEAVILGLLCTAGMMLLRFPYATMIGTLIGFTALIPIAGAYIGAGVGAFMIFTVSPIQALFFLIFIVVLQQLEGNIIYPRVVGSSLGLPGIWVLAAITVGGGLLGVAGMLLGVPLAAALYQLLKDDMTEGTLRQP